MTEKMSGALAELVTKTPDGKQIDREIVFKPNCEWYCKGLSDYLGAVRYDSLADVIDEFGINVAEEISEGKIVDVEIDVRPDYQKASCSERKFTKIKSPIRYPWPGAIKEYLAGYMPSKLPMED